MKKVIFALSAITMLAFASCTSNTCNENPSTATDSTVVSVDSAKVDSVTTVSSDTSK